MIVVAMMGGRRWRTLALILGSGLHFAIAALLGLPSFGLTMIALLPRAANPVARPAAHGRWWSLCSQRKDEAYAD
ncbi:hypothetical protein [Amycolatopsis sp. cmx-4-61]|uniref:hypothetical protein n=1 Tax=Amycolatopsis sp. cmx-4-61 TaxID=2790937 RepID=UPI00397B3CE3